MSKTAVSAQIAGVGVDKLTGYIGTVSEVTRDSAESIGNSLNIKGHYRIINKL